MANDYLNSALMLMLILSGVLFLGQLGIQEYNPEATFGDDAKFLNNYGNSSLGTINSFSSEVLPTSENSISPETGNIFTDTFNTAKNWLINTTGIGYIIGLLSAPVTLLQSLGLPSLLVWVIGTAWFGFIIFLIIGWLFNK